MIILRKLRAVEVDSPDSSDGSKTLDFWSLRIVALSLAVGVTLIAVGCSSKAKVDQKPEAKTVLVEPVGRKDIDDVLSYPADLKPSAEVRVFSRLPDRILAFPWKDGDEIQRGNRLAIIRAGGIGEGMQQVGAQIDALDAQIDTQQSEVDRLKRLLDSGAIAEVEYERLESALRANKAQRRALSAGKGQLAATASDGTILAPISGIVADKMLQVGDMAQPGVPLCRIIAVDKLKAVLRLVEVDIAKVQIGQEVQFLLDAHPGHVWKGTVTTVLPYLDQQTRTNTVEVSVDNPSDATTGKRALKPGMFGRAELVVSRRKAVLVAPESALVLDSRILEQQKPGETVRKAFVIDEKDVAKERLVQLGVRKGTVVELLRGLAEGERLVVRGQHGLSDGQKVQIVEARKP